MLTLVIGENSSGKSRWAEHYAAGHCAGRLVYIATMIPADSEGEERVARHRRQRRDLDFITLELPIHLSPAEIEPADTVLIEDMANLLANQMFEASPKGDAQTVLDEVKALCNKCAQVVAVTIGGLRPLPQYDGETHTYIAALNRLNGALVQLADLVVEMAAGEPMVRKGETAWQ